MRRYPVLVNVPFLQLNPEREGERYTTVKTRVSVARSKDCGTEVIRKKEEEEVHGFLIERIGEREKMRRRKRRKRRKEGEKHVKTSL